MHSLEWLFCWKVFWVYIDPYVTCSHSWWYLYFCDVVVMHSVGYQLRFAVPVSILPHSLPCCCSYCSGWLYSLHLVMLFSIDLCCIAVHYILLIFCYLVTTVVCLILELRSVIYPVILHLPFYLIVDVCCCYGTCLIPCCWCLCGICLLHFISCSVLFCLYGITFAILDAILPLPFSRWHLVEVIVTLFVRYVTCRSTIPAVIFYLVCSFDTYTPRWKAVVLHLPHACCFIVTFSTHSAYHTTLLHSVDGRTFLEGDSCVTTRYSLFCYIPLMEWLMHCYSDTFWCIVEHWWPVIDACCWWVLFLLVGNFLCYSVITCSSLLPRLCHYCWFVLTIAVLEVTLLVRSGMGRWCTNTWWLFDICSPGHFSGIFCSIYSIDAVLLSLMIFDIF